MKMKKVKYNDNAPLTYNMVCRKFPLSGTILKLLSEKSFSPFRMWSLKAECLINSPP